MGMDLEELNKSQIVLLTMLVSFVTSIATGIVTVSLIEETPADVTRVVQRVVERTVEQVSPAETQQATVITTEKTIVVRESDLIAAAVAENGSKIVRIVERETGAFASLAFFVDTNGTAAADGSTLVKGGVYAIVIGEEEPIPVKVVREAGARGVVLLGLDTEDRVTAPAVRLVDGGIKLGQTVVAFVGNGSIAQGIVTQIGDGGYIETSIKTAIPPGAPLINVDGDVVGLSTGASREVIDGAFTPAIAIAAQAAEPASATDKEEGAATSTPPQE